MTSTPTGPQITDGPRSKHAQLTDVLADLAVRELGPDVAIPSERELMTTYDVSRATVRKAIDTLVTDGLLSRIHGKGTFVARPRLESTAAPRLVQPGHAPTRAHAVDPARSASSATDRRPTSPRRCGWGATGEAWRIDRVRLADGQPIALEQGWYPEPALPGLDREDLTGSLYEMFRSRYGHTIDAAEQTLWGETADPALARRLDAPLHTPLLVFRRVSSAAGTPLEYVVSRYRGDRYQLHMSLGRDEHDPQSGPDRPGSTHGRTAP